ncbi:hypothetical protein MKW92_011454 [Papaver armeniacum]|nr:hypothetical protein MKW92_011454 [Papaver armeniacum]
MLIQGESPYVRQIPPKSTRTLSNISLTSSPFSTNLTPFSLIVFGDHSIIIVPYAGAPMLDHPAILQYRLRKENYLYISILTTRKQYRSCSLPNGILPAR